MSGTIHNPIRGPYTKQAFGKFLHKGEDAWLQQPKLSWGSKSNSKGVSVGYDVFGVFDGHGGKQAANFAAKHVLPTLQQELAEITLTPDEAVPEELEAYSQLSDEDKLAWHTQDALVQQLPAALVKSFQKVQEQFHENTQISGATATVAVIVGWDLVVASVGDSTAYLDTGAEVVQVSDTHRLDDNKAERKRCQAGGSEVCKSTVDGKPVGPDRVWPGGLAMSRTIGDYMAGDVVLPEPEVRRVALPRKGARLIIASDGLWDAMNPKTAAHHVRGMQAGKAAGELVQAALKSKGLRDDITVLVIDAMPDDSFRLPPFLAKQNGGYAVTLEDVGSVDWHKPLDEAAAADACASNTWQRRIAAVQAQFKLTSAADSDHSSDTNAADLQSACSDSAADSAAFETPYMSPQPLLEEDLSEWETVPVKPKREASTTAAASTPDGWAEAESSQGEAGEWEIPHKQTKLSHQPEGSPEAAIAIKAMRNGDTASGSGSAPDSRQKRPNRGRGRGRGQNRGRGRGRNDGNSSDGRRRYDHSQQGQSDDRQDTEASSAAQQQHSPEGDVASSWGAETVFPLAQSPLMPSPLDSSSMNSVPKVLTVPRQPHTRSMSNFPSSKQQQHQQHGRGNRGDTNSRGSNRNGRGRQNGPAQYVQPGPMYHKPEQPASQNFSFGSFGADDFGSTFDASKPSAAVISAVFDGNSSAQVYQDGRDKVLKQHSHRGGIRGRGRGRGRSQGRGRSGSFGKNRQDGHADAYAPAPVA
ncbi:TPA: hypothetical protein ACH3X2_006882 [Trebouxia sp. C0005]